MKPVQYFSPKRIYRFLRRECIALRHWLNYWCSAKLSRISLQEIRQRPQPLLLDLDNVSNYSELRVSLAQKNVRFSEGKHTIYVPPQDEFFKIAGPNADLYPPDAGFKLLKRFTPLEHANYLVDGYRQPVIRAMMGQLENQADAAGFLYSYRLGPRLYDLVEIQSSCFKTGCFVVQHIDGESPSKDEWAGFMQRMKHTIEHLGKSVMILRPEGWEHCDFAPPNCGGNLLRRADGTLFYIDFQQFSVVDKAAIIADILEDSTQTFHFGATRRVFGSKPYLYQSIPGLVRAAKRDVQERWKVFHKLLTDSDIDIEGRCVLDICCNMGMFMSLSLASGARIGLGWDLPEVAAQAERLQCIIGNTRILFFPAQLDSDYKLSKDIPNWLARDVSDSIVFYLAAWRHVGLISDLASIPWCALIFEGHQEDSEEETIQLFSEMESLWGCRLVSQTTINDGDSEVRAVALFVRDESGLCAY
jgi:hypothetical protein